MNLSMLMDNMSSSELTAHMAYDCINDENFMREFNKRHKITEEQSNKIATASELRGLFGLLN